MHTFWNNINKYPRFFISIIIGFFLTTFRPIFELLGSEKNKILIGTIIIGLMFIILQILESMLGVK
nr:hypothetical protein [Gloiopeltis furcata]